MGSSVLRRLGVAVPVVAALAVCAVAQGANIDGTLVQSSKLKIKGLDTSLPKNVGGKLKCGKGKAILNGGAFWNQTGIGPDPAISNSVQLTSSAPLGVRKWYADGSSSQASPRTLTIEVRCLPSERLKPLVTRTESKTLDSGTAGLVRAHCPSDFSVFSGGAYLSNPGKPPRPNVGPERGRITGTFPRFDDWTAIGGNFSEGKMALTAVARCYPSDRVDTSAGFMHPTVANGATGGGYLSCGAASAALAGGVSWSTTTSNVPDPELASSTYLSGNATTFAVDGHYAAGINLSGQSLDLDVIGICPAL